MRHDTGIRIVVCVMAVAVPCLADATQQDIAKFDRHGPTDGITVTNGLKWIDGKLLPIECGARVGPL